MSLHISQMKYLTRTLEGAGVVPSNTRCTAGEFGEVVIDKDRWLKVTQAYERSMILVLCTYENCDGVPNCYTQGVLVGVYKPSRNWGAKVANDLSALLRGVPPVQTPASSKKEFSVRDCLEQWFQWWSEGCTPREICRRENLRRTHWGRASTSTYTITRALTGHEFRKPHKRCSAKHPEAWYPFRELFFTTHERIWDTYEALCEEHLAIRRAKSIPDDKIGEAIALRQATPELTTHYMQKLRKEDPEALSLLQKKHPRPEDT